MSFVSPADGDRVPQVITASGTAVGVRPGHQLWLFVQAQPDGRLLPVAVTQSGTDWTATGLYVGGEDQAGEPFTLHLADLDTTAQHNLDGYFAREQEANSSPGLSRTDLDAWRVSFLAEVDVVRSS